MDKRLILQIVIFPPSGFIVLKDRHNYLIHLGIFIFLMGSIVFFLNVDYSVLKSQLGILTDVVFLSLPVTIIITSITWRIWIIEEVKEKLENDKFI